jgi:predicted ester cyclase
VPLKHRRNFVSAPSVGHEQAKGNTVQRDELTATYRAYIDCLNSRDLSRLVKFIDDDARHNGRRLGLSGYREMLEGDYEDIPDLLFKIELLAVDPPYVASRLRFDVSPKGRFLGLDINGRKVSFTENVFYEFREGKIVEVWSVLDKTVIEGQL